MRICIPTETRRGLHADEFAHFGTAPFFTIVDIETGHVRVVPNPQCHDRPHKCHHLDILQAHDVGAVVCTHIGRRATEALRGAGVEVLGPAEGTVGDVVREIRAGGVAPLAPGGGCGEGRGGRCGHGHH